MESPWNLAAIGTGRTALGASLFPLGTALAYAVARTYGAAMAVLLSGGVLFGLAFVATLVLLAVGGRAGGNARSTAAGLLGSSVLALITQIMLAIAIASAWSSTSRFPRSRPLRHRSSLPRTSPNRPNRAP